MAAAKFDGELANSVKVLNIKTGELKNATSKTTLAKGKEKFVFACELYVKDYSNLLSNQFVRVTLVIDDQHDFFHGIGPVDILKKKKAQDEVRAAFTTLERFNVWVEATVRIAHDGSLLITRETTLKEYQ